MTDNTLHLELYYKKNWARLNITLGSVFSVIFLLGAAVLHDLTQLLYLLLTAVIIIMGVIKLKKPYVICTESPAGERNESSGTISVFSSFGQIIHHYTYKSPKEITVKGNRLYQNGKKLKFNSWLINQHQWDKIISYYARGKLPVDDLQDY